MDKLKWLISYLKNESGAFLPSASSSEFEQFRILCNTRLPNPISNDFLHIQNLYLQELLATKQLTTINDINPISNNIYLWQGDITTLKVDAIVNAANNKMLGCFFPCHNCIDNAIHTYAGVQLRLECDNIMKLQGYDEPTGVSKITNGYNLPCKYVIHTVGPIVYETVTEKEILQLQSSYKSLLKLAKNNRIKTLAICCISTGEFRFPNQLAAEIAIQSINNFFQKNPNLEMKVIFNVFKNQDYSIYQQLLKRNR